jgi:transglutaminase-like putative cysteine protease
MGVLVVAAFNPLAKITPLLLAPGAAMFVYLAMTGRGAARKDAGLPSGAARLVVAAAGTAAMAWGIIVALPVLQTQVEKATFGIFSPQAADYPSLRMRTQLGDVERLNLSNKIVMRVWTTHPQKLRGRVFTQFDGRSWAVKPPRATPLVPAPEEQPFPGVRQWLEEIPGSTFVLSGEEKRDFAAPGLVRTKIVQITFNSGMMVAPGQKILVRAPVEQLRMDETQTMAFPLTEAMQIYGFVNRRSGNVAQVETLSPERRAENLALRIDADARMKALVAELAAAGGTQEERRAKNIVLSADIDPRWEALAAELAAAGGTEEARIARTVAYVQGAASYSLEVGKFHSRQPVTEFFFEKKRGYCQYFASAAVILLRAQGIPARYVTGFNVQEWNRPGGHFVVREADAHAWIEAYVAGKGWIEADPTPDAEFAARREATRPGWAGEAMESVSAWMAEAMIWVRGGDWGAAFRWLWAQARILLLLVLRTTVGVVLLAGAAAWMLVRWLRQRKKSASKKRARAAGRVETAENAPELADLLARVEELWARGGAARPASRGPLEHLQKISPEKISPALRETSRKVVECYYRASFGGMHPEAGQIEELRRVVRKT